MPLKEGLGGEKRPKDRLKTGWIYGFPYYVRQLPLELFPWKPNKLKLLHQVHRVISWASDPKPLPSSGGGLKLKGNFIFQGTTILKVCFFGGSHFMCKITISNLKSISKSCSRLQTFTGNKGSKTHRQWPCKENPKLNMKLRIQQIYTSNIHIGYDIFCWNLSLVEISKIEYETENTTNLQV